MLSCGLSCGDDSGEGGGPSFTSNDQNSCITVTCMFEFPSFFSGILGVTMGVLFGADYGEAPCYDNRRLT